MIEYKYCKCKSHDMVTTDCENEFGYWEVCTVCGKRIEDSFTYYNHYDGEDHEEMWGPDGDIL
ncbi:MAG: hypothetical protein J6Y02_09740 [Pseudobutyrivibrio sp.]|nr:hypothetical protein [Pseudobutyrivibrio sp.]